MGDCSSGGFSDDFKVLFWSNGEARVVVLLIFGVVMTVFFCFLTWLEISDWARIY